MKNLFSIDMKTSDILCEAFVARKSSNKIVRKKDELDAEYSKIRKELMCPVKLLYIFASIFGVVFIIMVSIVFNKDLSLRVAVKRYFWAVITGAIAFIVVTILSLIANKLYKRNRESLYSWFFKEFNELYMLCAKELFLPEECDEADILLLKTEKKNKFSRKKSNYMTSDMGIFAGNGTLCLTDYEKVICIPFDAISELKEIKERIFFAGIWYKEEHYLKGRYKKYKIKYHKWRDCFSVPSYYSLNVRRAEEQFEILFPNYEEDILKKYVANIYSIGVKM